MNNDKLKFVVDSRSFDGSCVTTMSDGIHGDYHHETLEELRDREKNPCLTAVSGNTVRKMIRIHLQSLCAPFSEITEERYFDYMDVFTSRDSAPLPRQGRSWNGRWTTITGTLPSKETSRKKSRWSSPTTHGMPL